MNIGFVSLGCSKNLVDSEKIMGLLKSQGYDLVANPQEADYIFVNTCGFINSAKEESIQTILEMAEHKNNRCKKLIMLGCLAQRYKEELIKELPEVDCFISIDEYPDLLTILGRELKGEFVDCDYRRLLSTKPWTAYLKIAEGCSNRCSYCAIPLIRHDYQSYDFDELIREASYLESKGVKEINIIAQDTTRYGIDKYGKPRLLDLLNELNSMEGFRWIRVLYMYPDEISEGLILGMAKLSKVLPYFDIPVQHGNDEMLAKMNRRGSIVDIKKTIKLIRDTFVMPTLRTTMIVGFPQETAADFADLLDFVAEVKWDRLGAFSYSLEEDTKSFEMEPKVDENTAQKRLAELMKVQEDIVSAKSMEMIGKDIEVLLESFDGLTKRYKGRSASSAPDGIDGIVMVETSREYQLGEFVMAKVVKANKHDLFAVAD